MKPVVVFVHVHYADTWPAIRERLQACMTVPFKVVLTTTTGLDGLEAPDTPFLADMRVHVTENRGRDVRPFLEALRAEEPFEIGLKLHGKKSVHRLDGDAWRDALVLSLLPDRQGVEALVGHLQDDRRIALVAPAHALCSIDRHVGRNMGAMREVADRLDMNLRRAVATSPFFPAGTMFWFRREALEPVLRVHFDDAFPAERRQTDGTVAHAFERLFAVIAESTGGVAVPADLLDDMRIDMPVDAMRDRVRRAVDTDTTYVRRPGRLGVFVLRYLWFAMPIYAALPPPVRRQIKGTIGRLRRPQGTGSSG